jgi:hypothetical protein
MGILAATVANHGSRMIKTPYKASDFMPYLPNEEEKPLQLATADAQSTAIMKLVFNRG